MSSQFFTSQGTTKTEDKRQKTKGRRNDFVTTTRNTNTGNATTGTAVHFVATAAPTASAATMATPALGPSFGVAPAGT